MNIESMNPLHHGRGSAALVPIVHRDEEFDRSANAQPLTLSRLSRAKIAFTTRRVPTTQMASLLEGDCAPQMGDVLLAQVKKIGQHAAIALPSGRRARLFPGDELVLCYGNRYAPDQFEAEVPPDMSACDLVAAGGVAARVISRHQAMRPATALEPIGLVGDAAGRRINVADWALAPIGAEASVPTTVAVLGTSMNSGKTTTVANLIRGLVRAGLSVGAAKVTGTGAPNDTEFFRDAGANPVLDFTDAGVPSTYLVPPERVERILSLLVRELARDGVDVIVLEVADGLYQTETRALVQSHAFRQCVDAVVFAARDAMGATAGVEWLRHNGLPAAAASGLLTASPLATTEAKQIVGLPVLGIDDLTQPDIGHRLGLRFRGAPRPLCRLADCVLCRSS